MPFLPFLRKGRGSSEARSSEAKKEVVEEVAQRQQPQPTAGLVEGPLVIAFSSTKGGCGKSLLATGSAFIASAAGEKVLIVDLDITNMTATMITIGSLGMRSEELYSRIYKSVVDIKRFSSVGLLKESLKILQAMEQNKRLVITKEIGGPPFVRSDVHGLFIPAPGTEHREPVPLAYLGDIYFIPAAPLSIAEFERERFFDMPADELNEQVAAMVQVLRKIAGELGITRVFIDLPPTDRLKIHKPSYKWIQVAAEKSDTVFLVTEYVSSGEVTPAEIIGFVGSFRGFDGIVERSGGIIVNKVDPSILSGSDGFTSTSIYSFLGRGFPKASSAGKIYAVPYDPSWSEYKQYTSRQIHPIFIMFRGAGAALTKILLREGVITRVPGSR
ncbi:MAG: AAA family ATPase [Sulfolobales archaeon]